jgi:hypothetical protein
MTVELRRLELSFSVNSRNLLESSQLRSEIDPDQDAGTWYGLKSKLVLRKVVPQSSVVQRQRSIIVPVGEAIGYKRSGVHVEILVQRNNDAQAHFATFTINEVLGRIDCPAETRLLCHKAQFHAYTSSIFPDTLTRRTGTEEAIHCLTLGCSQPWTPMMHYTHHALKLLANLTPNRVYYPKDRKVMQSCSWDPHFTTTIQHDGYRDIVNMIMKKSDQLSTFAMHKN